MREISTSLVACACTDIKASASGLTEGQLSGCLRRNLKNGCVARAEGKLQKIEFTGRITDNSLRRYDVYIDGLTPVEYHPGPNLGRTGVKVVV